MLGPLLSPSHRSVFVKGLSALNGQCGTEGWKNDEKGEEGKVTEEGKCRCRSLEEVNTVHLAAEAADRRSGTVGVTGAGQRCRKPGTVC